MTRLRDFSSTDTRIGWIGTGVMGAPMCGHLMDKGHPAVVHNRTRDKAAPLLEKGAQWADSPRAVTEQSDIVFTMVGFPPDVRQVYFGERRGVLPAAREGMVFVDMTTTEPTLARKIAEASTAKGAFAVDAPVSGGDVGARGATLSIMVGGDDEAVRAVMPLLETMGENIVHQGPPGAGQHTKMCNQIAIAGTMIGVCESLLYGQRAGLNMRTVLESIGGGAAACWTLDNLAPRCLARNFDPGFLIDHFIKDMGIALDEAERMNLSMPGLALVRQLYLAARAQGHGKNGTHALLLALEQMANAHPQH